MVGVGRCCSAVVGVGRCWSGLFGVVRLWSGLVEGWVIWSGRVLGGRGCSGLVRFGQVCSVLFGMVGAAGYLVGADSGWSRLFGFGQVCSAVVAVGRLLRGGWRRALVGLLFCCGGATVSRGGVGCGAVAARRAGKSCELVLAGSSGWWRCERSWVWAPDQVWGDGSWGGEVGCCARRDAPVRARGRLRGKRGYDGPWGRG